MATKTRKAQKVVSVPENIINDAPRTVTDADFPVGSVAHQGDIILVRIKALPKPAKAITQRQLAEGNTQGSRHVLSTGSVYQCDDVSEVVKAISVVCKGVEVGEQFIGPVIGTLEGVADVVHPEHGDHFYRGDMVIAVVYQRNLDSEQRERRVVD